MSKQATPSRASLHSCIRGTMSTLRSFSTGWLNGSSLSDNSASATINYTLSKVIEFTDMIRKFLLAMNKNFWPFILPFMATWIEVVPNLIFRMPLNTAILTKPANTVDGSHSSSVRAVPNIDSGPCVIDIMHKGDLGLIDVASRRPDEACCSLLTSDCLSCAFWRWLSVHCDKSAFSFSSKNDFS